MLPLTTPLCPDDVDSLDTAHGFDRYDHFDRVTDQSQEAPGPPALCAHDMGYAVIRLRRAGSEFAEHLRNPRTGKWEKTGRNLTAVGKEPMGDWRTQSVTDRRTLAAMSSYGVNCALSGVIYLDLDTKAVPDGVAHTVDDKQSHVIETVSAFLGMHPGDLDAAVCNWTTSGGMGALFAQAADHTPVGTLKGLCGGMLDTRGGWVAHDGSVHSAGQFVGPGSSIGANPVTGWSTYGGELPPIDELPFLADSAVYALTERQERHREVTRTGRVRQRQTLGLPPADPLRDLQAFRECAAIIAEHQSFRVDLRHGCFNAALVCAGAYHDGASFEDAFDALMTYLRCAGDRVGRVWVDQSGVAHDWSLDANERLLWQAINHDAKTRESAR